MLEDSSVDSFAEVFLRDHTLPIGVFDDFLQYTHIILVMSQH